MPLAPGQQLAHYRVERKIGEGGMGEVWASTDTRLNRAVAIKVLPAAVADDAERLARFKREAQLLAALSHPNIAAIYGLEKIEGTPYLALELVEGEELSERIRRGPIPVDDAIEIAGQIAAGLEEAHGKGIVHRDLKPANVKVAPDGKVKVLDFGLAKALSGDPAASESAVDLSRSPTVTATMGATAEGLILGTAAYMAPEQARGKRVDRRADIWAFGVILFEMLTGRRMFTGETVTDVIAAVVTREPDWERLPTETPAATRRLLRRCLQRDPRRRLRDIGDALLELEEHPVGDPAFEARSAARDAPQPVRGRRSWIVGAIGLVVGLLAAAAIRTALESGAAPARPTWSTLPPPAEASYDFACFIEISPDGRHVVFVAPSPAGNEPRLLWVRDLDSEAPRPLAGTEGAQQPFWSPDGRSIAYFARRKLRRVDTEGGVSTTLAEAGNTPRGGSWGADGTILFVPDWSQSIYRVDATGGTAEPVTEFNAERLELSHRWPHLLPDGRHFLFFVVSTYPELNPENPSEVDQSGLYLGSLDGTGPRLLQTARSRAAYTNGSLLYVDDGILMARPFDPRTLSFEGEPVSLADGVTQSVDALWGGALFSVSAEGTLLFVRGASERGRVSRLQWLDREGNELSAFGEPQPFTNMRISHDGRFLATTIGDPGDVWIHDLERRTSTRFTFDPSEDTVPIWSPDDDQIVFHSRRIVPGRRYASGNLFRKVSSGSEPEELLTIEQSDFELLPQDWSPAGDVLVLSALRRRTGVDIVLYSFEKGSIEPYLETDHDEDNPRLSPDGRWLAYDSVESGRAEVYVQSFPGSGGKWQVSTDGGIVPTWRSDGKELYYLGPEGLMAVAVETEGRFRSNTPAALFAVDAISRGYGGRGASYAPAPDGKRFLFMLPVKDETANAASVTLVQDWPGLLER